MARRLAELFARPPDPIAAPSGTHPIAAAAAAARTESAGSAARAPLPPRLNLSSVVNSWAPASARADGPSPRPTAAGPPGPGSSARQLPRPMSSRSATASESPASLSAAKDRLLTANQQLNPRAAPVDPQAQGARLAWNAVRAYESPGVRSSEALPRGGSQREHSPDASSGPLPLPAVGPSR